MDGDLVEELAYAQQLSGEHRFAEAEPIYRQLIASGHPVYSRFAAFNLGGDLLAQQRDPESLDLYRMASSGEHDEIHFAALMNLGTVLVSLDHHSSEVAAALEPVMAGGSAHAGLAASTMASVLRRIGRDDEAIACYRQAVSSGDPRVLLSAASNLGILLRDQGDLGGAEAALRIAADQRDVAATLGLADVLDLQGRRREAIELYSLVATSGLPVWANMAQTKLDALG